MRNSLTQTVCNIVMCEVIKFRSNMKRLHRKLKVHSFVYTWRHHCARYWWCRAVCLTVHGIGGVVRCAWLHGVDALCGVPDCTVLAVSCDVPDSARYWRCRTERLPSSSSPGGALIAHPRLLVRLPSSSSPGASRANLTGPLTCQSFAN